MVGIFKVDLEVSTNSKCESSQRTDDFLQWSVCAPLREARESRQWGEVCSAWLEKIHAWRCYIIFNVAEVL